MTATEPGGRSAPSRARWIFIAASAVLLSSAFALCAFAPEPATVTAVGDQATAVPVDVVEVRARPLQRTTRLSAVVEARRRVELFAETAGRVVSLGAEELDAVEEGQLLLQMDPILADAGVERALAAIARAESQLALADSERKRFEKLATKDAASTSRRDQAVNVEKVARANLREAQALLAEARDTRSKKEIHAPFGGVLESFTVEKGEYLRGGERVAELLDLTTARLELGVTDREVVALEAGTPVSVQLEAYPGEAFTGTILRVGAAADTTTRKFPVEVELANPARRILPGMVARASLELGSPGPIRAIPRDALVDQFGVQFVFVVVAEGAGHESVRRPVQVRNVPFQPAIVEVVAGVEDGDQIAVSGIQELRDGSRVQPRASRTHVAGDAPEEPGT